MKLALTGCVCVLVGCGGDGGPFNPGIGDDPGTGTQTLLVDGSISAGPAFDNAQDALDFTTDFGIRIERGGTPVTTGEVTVESSAGAVALVFSTDGNEWRGTQSGYFEVYALDVVSDQDTVEGVRIDGPDIHWFDAPIAGATVDASVPLEVDWSRDHEADSATIETDGTDRIGIADTGTYTIAVGGLRSNQGETTEERLELRRMARVVPAGGAGGSELSVQIENRVDLVVAPCPTCAN